ncbi:MAG: hypothetical protein ABFS28_07010 [Bacteroidota bacterium]
MKREILLIAILIICFVGAQGQTSGDWGDSAVLDPSFAGDNRFNKTLDLSGNYNTTPDVPDWTQDLILYQMRIDKFGTQPTINSAREKIHILEELGITGVVLNPLVRSHKMPGSHEEWSYYSHVEIDTLEPGIYFYSISINGLTGQTRSMIVQ